MEKEVKSINNIKNFLQDIVNSKKGILSEDAKIFLKYVTDLEIYVMKTDFKNKRKKIIQDIFNGEYEVKEN